MPLSERLRSFLESHSVEYSVTVHPRAYTAREVAAVEHLPPRELAKTVVLIGDGEYFMVVIPASKVVDLPEARLILGSNQVRLATEDELGKLFPDCELGAMPPFGSLYRMPVYLDSSLTGEDRIAFNAGTHREVLHMKMSDFRGLVQPTAVSLVREPLIAHGL
ncbi:MAG: YbaK/EbsC family protein [Bryobacteraceae bacterium]